MGSVIREHCFSGAMDTVKLSIIAYLSTIPIVIVPLLSHFLKVTVYTLLMNYSYETVYCCWAESLLLAQISMMYYESAPKIMSCSEKLGFIGQSDAFLWLIRLV